MNLIDLYEKGVNFETFLSTEEGTYKDKVLNLYNNITIDTNLIDKIRHINKKIKILVFAEIWCPDCMINVPAVKKLSDLNHHIGFRILPREGNESYLNPYLVGGKAKIPTFIIMDENYNILGAFIEKPHIVKEIEEKGQQVDIIVIKKRYRKGELIKDTIEDIIKIIR